jgi:putative FmdB family regulatory protein
MPIFEYQCKKCGQVIEILQLGATPKELTCTKCGSDKLQKLLSSFSSHSEGNTGTSEGSCPTGTCPLS